MASRRFTTYFAAALFSPPFHEAPAHYDAPTQVPSTGTQQRVPSVIAPRCIFSTWAHHRHRQLLPACTRHRQKAERAQDGHGIIGAADYGPSFHGCRKVVSSRFSFTPRDFVMQHTPRDERRRFSLAAPPRQRIDTRPDAAPYAPPRELIHIIFSMRRRRRATPRPKAGGVLR